MTTTMAQVKNIQTANTVTPVPTGQNAHDTETPQISNVSMLRRMSAGAPPALPMRPSQSMLLQRQCSCGGSAGAGGECAECKAKSEEAASVQRKAESPVSQDSGAAPSIVHDVLRSPGQPLDSQTRSFMEPRFGQDFSGVRIHTDTKAAESAKAVNAAAYAVGSNVVFGAGRYVPGTSEGQRLMAHELTHVVQQGSGIHRMPASLEIGSVNDPAEREADASADAVMRGAPVRAARQEEPAVRRITDPSTNVMTPPSASPATATPQAGGGATQMLVYASGYPNIHTSIADEHSNHHWMPSSVDFQATAQSSGGGSGQATFQGLLGQIQSAAPHSIQGLDLIGHANQNVFALGGTITRGGGVSATAAGVIDKPTLDTAVQNGTIPPLRSRFAKGAAITFYACHASVAGPLLGAMSQAFGVCTRGFTTELEWCLRSTATQIVSRGHVRQMLGTRPHCEQFPVTVYSLKPDSQDCSGAPITNSPGDFPSPPPGKATV